MKRNLLLSLCLLLAVTIHAQSYQWIKGGGSTNSIDIYTNYPERVWCMCTDSNGNIYALSLVGDQNIRADTFYLSAAHSVGGGGSAGSDINLMITSYRCDGTMRWARLLEDNAISRPSGITYNQGSIYVSGTSDGNDKYIADSLVSTSDQQFGYLASFDTSGNFRWVQYVGKAD